MAPAAARIRSATSAMFSPICPSKAFAYSLEPRPSNPFENSILSRIRCSRTACAASPVRRAAFGCSRRPSRESRSAADSNSSTARVSESFRCAIRRACSARCWGVPFDDARTCSAISR